MNTVQQTGTIVSLDLDKLLASTVPFEDHSRFDDGHDNDDDQNADTDPDDDPPLHVLPPIEASRSVNVPSCDKDRGWGKDVPHLLPDPVSTSSEPLCRDGEII